MALDRVQPLKLEDTSTGTEEDLFPTALDRNEDFVDCHGVTLQDTESDDDAVVLGRDGSGNMMFQDEHVAPVSLSALTAGGFDINNVVWDVAGGLVYANDENAVTRV
jgi:hypothetical protein